MDGRLDRSVCPLPLLIGEAPSRTSDPDRPFSGRSGARLAKLLDRPLDEVFELRNVFGQWPGPAGATGKGTAWDRVGARDRARIIGDRLDGRTVVLVGRRVAAAFEYPSWPYLVWGDDVRGFRFSVVPHPSGIVRFWNDPDATARAAAFLRAAACLDRRRA